MDFNSRMSKLNFNAVYSGEKLFVKIVYCGEMRKSTVRINKNVNFMYNRFIEAIL